jgi:protein-S-isoprenylcysteine O-methyltransferase Ste14
MDICDRWISLLHRTATGTKKMRTLLTPIGLAIFGIFTGLFVLLAVFVDRWFSLSWPLSSGLSWVCAIPLITVGFGLSKLSASHFMKVKGTAVPFNPPSTLVMTGPYKFVRNPMLTGVFLLLFGIGFAMPITLTCRLIHTALYIRKRMGNQRDRGTRVSEAIRRRLCCLSTANPDVHA